MLFANLPIKLLGRYSVQLILAVLVFPAYAEQTRVEQRLMCTIAELQGAPGKPERIHINCGDKHGIGTGSRGALLARGKEGGISYAGRVEVVEVHERDSWVRVQEEAGSNLDAVTTAGVVEMSMLLPEGTYRGLLYDLYVKGITFLDNYKQPIVTLEQVLNARDDSIEKQTLASMVEAGHEVVEFTTDMKEQVDHGKWKGKCLAPILEQSTPDDYRAFLRFVRDYPGKYIGKPWKISETYATWLINNAPLSNEDMLIEIKALEGKPEFASRIAALSAGDTATLFDMLSDEIDALPAKEYATGEHRLKLLESMLAARQLPSVLLRAKVENARARLWLLDPKTRADAAAAYSRAAALYAQVTVDQDWSAPLDSIVCLNNEANTYYSLNQPDEVLRRLPLIRAQIAALRAAPPNAEIAAHVQLAEAYTIGLGSRIANDRGDYRQVVSELTPLLGRYATVGAPGFRQKEIDLIKFLAKAHQKLGENEVAAKLLERAAERAQELGDPLRQAEMAWEIGDLHYASSRYTEAVADYQRTAQLARDADDKAMQAKALAAAGQAYWSLGKPQEALAQHRQAMQLSEALGNDSSLAWQLLQVGKIHVEQGERIEARHDFERALALHVKLDEKSEEADVHLQLGQLFVAMKQPGDAEKEYAAARAMYQTLKKAPDEAWAILGAAGVQAQKRDFTQAVQLAAEAATIADRIGDHELMLRSRLVRWQWLRASGQVVAARAILDEALAAAGTDVGLRIDVLVALAEQQQDEGDLLEAQKSVAEALQLSEGSKDAARRLAALYARAGILSVLGEYAESIHVYEQIAALAQENGNRPALADALQLKAFQLAQLGRLIESKQAAQESLQVAQQNSDPVAQAWSMNTLSEVADHYGDIREQLRLYDAAIPLMQQAESRFGEAALTFNRAQVSAELRDFDEALKGIDTAEILAGNDINFDFRVHVAALRAEVLGQMGRFEEADKALLTALEMARKSYPVMTPELLRVRGRLLTKQGDYIQALPVLKEAVRIEEQRNTDAFGALADFGIAQAHSGNADAEATLRSAIARAEKAGGRLPWEALYQLGRIQAEAKQIDQALKTLERATSEIEKGEVVLQSEAAKTRYWGDKAGVYVLLVRLLLGQDQVGNALRYVERAKAAELVDLSRNSGGREGDLGLELEIAESRFDKELRIEQAKPKPDTAKMQRLDELLADVRMRRADYIDKLDRELTEKGGSGRDVYSIRPLELEKLQEYIPPGTLVLSPMSLDEKLVVFAITHEAITHFDVPVNSQEMDRLVTAMLGDMSSAAVARRGSEPLQRGASRLADAAVGKPGGTLRESSTRLYDLLIRPAFQRFGTPKVLVVSAAGSLRYLPFAALHDGKSWLMEKTSLIEVTSLDQQKFTATATTGKATVLALADPDGTLPGARKEVSEVKSVFGDVHVLDGEEATLTALRSEIRSPGYDIVHLATHGRLDGAHPDQSHILLSGQPLYYKDIPGLRFARTKLVVLSACDTAARGSGVEITGLAYQFERTNVRSVVATLWPVDDDATAMLMADFYKNLRDGNGYVQALAKAQRALAADNRYQHPFYWGPFVLIGAP
jgi:CHAT domain-containing protein